jgi:pimeloyl-[acyl-carrier protein] methyl ester esterase
MEITHRRHFPRFTLTKDSPQDEGEVTLTSPMTIPLILLPGLDGTEVFFRPLLATLPSWVKPVVVSYPTSGPNSYEDLLPLVEAATANLDDFFVLGWSFSGPLALLLAAKNARRTRGVILSASFIRPPLPFLSWLRFAVGTPLVMSLRLVRRAPGLVGRWNEQFTRDKAATWHRVPARTLAARAQAILTVDTRGALRACRAPVLYLAGSHDRVVPFANAEAVVREVPTTRVETIAGPHLAMYTNPVAASTAITRFMQSSTKSVHGTLAHFITESEKIPPSPPLEKGGTKHPLS